MTGRSHMRPRMRSRLLSRLHGDEGMSLVLVIAMVAIISLMAITTATIATNSLQSSRHHTTFESSLATAEAGVDSLLSSIALQNAADPNVEYVTSSPCSLTAPSTGFASNEAERVWARDALANLAATQAATCLKTASNGQYVSVRPSGKQAVYSMGWFPAYSATATRRLIKAEYLFAPYAPSNAVLTQGGLDFSGSVAITALVSTTDANVHTNTNIAGYNNSLQVAGAISASGTLPGSCPSGVQDGCTASSPLQTIPDITARKYYVGSAAANASSWYDLCPTGLVKSPPTTITATTVPCTGATIGGTGYNGWQFTAGSGSTPPRWTLPRTAGGPFPGTYYVYQGDAQVGDNGNSSTVWQITVIAEAATGVTNAATCNKLGGNIQWKLFNMTPKLPGMQLLADANLTGDANASAGSGLFFAGDKVDLQTSSSTLTGAVIAANTCAAAGQNTIQGVSIEYDDTLELAVSDVIRTALWLEYPSG